jgi:glucose-6-phosphate isomerase
MKKINNLLKSLHQKGLLDDNGVDRRGWARQPSWEKEIKPKLKQFLEIAEDKTDFVFIGMGGSINTVKAVGKILENEGENKVFTLDSLDPEAIKELRPKIDPAKTLVVGISKSGTTRETAQLANTLKDICGDFLWLTDPANEGKIKKGDWENTPVLPIQVDNKADIGGRFTAPHTLISFLPLLILNNKDLNKVEEIWNEYITCSNDLVETTIDTAKLLDSSVSNFAICLPENLCPALETWIIQLFQESLGSKKDGYNPKTMVVNKDQIPEDFDLIAWDIETSEEVVRAMTTMYLAQVLVAQIALNQTINFVNQPGVEKYKEEMRNMADGKTPEAKMTTLDELTTKIEEKIKENDYKFIEAVCYWHLKEDERQKLKVKLEERFGDKIVLVFTGSDWNHHSYQAADQNKDTLFLILTKPNYLDSIKNIDGKKLKENIEDLKIIAGATYKTISDKSIFLSLTN